MAWIVAAIWVVALVAVYAMMPKPQTQPPARLEDIQTPTAEEGRELQVLFGTRDIPSPNIVWYGDLKTVAVKKKSGKK